MMLVVGLVSACEKRAEQQPPPTLDGMPQDCLDYIASLPEIAKCSAVPEATRKEIVETGQKTAAIWASMSVAQRPNLAPACRSAVDVLRETLSACKSPP